MSNKCGGGRCVRSVTYLCEDVKRWELLRSRSACEKERQNRSLIWSIEPNHTFRNHNSPNLALVYHPVSRSASWLFCAGVCKLLPVWACTVGQALQRYQAIAHFSTYFSRLELIKFCQTFWQGALTFSWRILLNDGALGRGNGQKERRKKKEEKMVYVLSCWKQRCQSRTHRWMHLDMQTHHSHIINTWYDGRRFTDD